MVQAAAGTSCGSSYVCATHGAHRRRAQERLRLVRGSLRRTRRLARKTTVNRRAEVEDAVAGQHHPSLHLRPAKNTKRKILNWEIGMAVGRSDKTLPCCVVSLVY
jgi:hypothetical protein